MATVKKCRNANCKLEFEADPSRPDQVYCHPRCRKAAWNRAKRPSRAEPVVSGDDGADIRRHRAKTESVLIRAQNRRLKDQVAAANRIVEAAKESLESLPPVEISIRKVRSAPHVSEEEALLFLTDLHIGARFSRSEMGGLNFYDVDEFSRRLKHTVDSAIRFTKGKPDLSVKRIVVYLGGDVVDGLIHESIERNADVQIADQVVVGSHILSLAMRELAAEFEQVHIACAPGNHGRFRKPHEAEMVTQNFDTLLYVLMKERLKLQKNITWSIPREFWNYQQLAGHGYLLLHGHVGIKGFTGNATYPGYGLRRSADNLQHILSRIGKPVRYIGMGHYHNYSQQPHGTGFITINGSMIGPNPYSVASGFAAQDALQILQLFNRKFGLTSQHPITPQVHGFGTTVPYKWQRDSFDQ